MIFFFSGYNVKRIQNILNQIRQESGKYVQIDRQRAAVLTSIHNLQLKAQALTNERIDIKNDIAVSRLSQHVWLLATYLNLTLYLAEIDNPARANCRLA